MKRLRDTEVAAGTTPPGSLCAALRAWVEEDHEGRVMTLVEDGSFSEYVRELLNRYEEAKGPITELDAGLYRAVVREGVPAIERTDTTGAVLASHMREARDNWRDAFLLITGVRDGGYATAEVREALVAQAVKRAEDADKRADG